MRRYTITVGESSYVIDVQEVTGSTFQVRVDGAQDQAFDVQLVDHQDVGHGQVGPAMQVRPAAVPAMPSAPWPPPTAKPAASEPTAASTPRHAAAADPPITGEPPVHPPVSTREALIMTAPMPGTVLSIDVTVGQTVKRGDILLVFEAMKMKNALHASRGGRIAELLVSAGQQVQHGQALVRFDA